MEEEPFVDSGFLYDLMTFPSDVLGLDEYDCVSFLGVTCKDNNLIFVLEIVKDGERELLNYVYK